MTSDKTIAAFQQLHVSGCFVLPNPWDVGSAHLLQSLGFPALATSSAAVAFTLGRPDSPTSLGRDSTLENIRTIVNATELPVNADFQAGYGDTADAVAQSVAMCVATGAAGLSIEDASGDPSNPLHDLPIALERLQAAREAIDASGRNVVLTGRAECFLVGHPTPLKEAIERLVAYAQAGAGSRSSHPRTDRPGGVGGGSKAGQRARRTGLLDDRHETRSIGCPSYLGGLSVGPDGVGWTYRGSERTGNGGYIRQTEHRDAFCGT